MKRFSAYLVYLLFLFLLGIFRILPFPLFYILSSFNYFLLYRVAGYRRRVVRGNLLKAFPEKTIGERLRIEKSFYRNLADIFMESLKGYALRPEELFKRFTVPGYDAYQKLEKQYPNIIVASAHCGNWEWGALAAPLLMKYRTYGLYKPIANTYIDAYIRRTRAVHGMHLVPIVETHKMFLNKESPANAYFFIADQSPSSVRQSIRVDFLGQPTLWLHGIEKYARMYDLPVFYFGIRREGRGRYSVFFKEITTQPRQMEIGEITRRYASILEEEIRNYPDNWLWSHRRWKKKVLPGMQSPDQPS